MWNMYMCYLNHVCDAPLFMKGDVGRWVEDGKCDDLVSNVAWIN